jgi:hypothetical protein
MKINKSPPKLEGSDHPGGDAGAPLLLGRDEDDCHSLAGDVAMTGPLARMLRDLPDIEPPAALLGMVMKNLQPKGLPWWRRVVRWARVPRSFTVTPLQLAPVAMLLLVVSTLAILGWVTDQHPHLIRSARSSQIPVSFNLSLPGAHSVAVIGTFNGWHAQGYEMQRGSEQQSWALELHLPAGRYEYAFLVDGQQIVADPRARFYQDDGFGNQNGVLIIGNQDETQI